MLPAGIISGTEAFWFNDEKWLIHEGAVMLFTDAPCKIQNMIANLFLNDDRSRNYLKSVGITSFCEGFDMWYKCVIGALDDTPDFKDGKLTADAYNHACRDMDCPHRGRLCSLAPGLKNYEVATINKLKEGHSIEDTADILCISTAGMKSRIEKIREKLGATNMASMMARAAEYGI